MVFRVLILCIAFLYVNSDGLCQSNPKQQNKQTQITAMQTPAVVTEFLKTVEPHPSAETYYEKAQEALWQVYPHDDSLKKELIAFIASGADSPGLGFAGLALIPFHDPNTVKPILDRALDRRISRATRWSFLNTVPYILSMGDAMYDGEGNLDQETLNFVKELRTAGEMASKTGAGHFHAVELRKIYDDKTEASQNSDYGLILLHQSAYLVGTLDLRDQTLLNVFLNPEQEAVCKNVIVALCLASNHDFLRALREKEEKEITDEAVQAAVTAASSWWQAYLRDHQAGDWLPAVVSGFREAGYKIEDDLLSASTRQELLRAMEAKSDVMRYNAYRLLNHIYKTHFDLERVFLGGKYAFSFLDPNQEKQQNEKRLREYWQKRLKGL